MKRIVSVFVALMVTMSMMTGCFAAESSEANFMLSMQIDNPIMTVNGEEQEIDPGRGSVPIVQNDRTLVPVRAIIEAMGGTVNWDEETQTALLEYNGDIITLTIGSTTAYFNETANTLDVAPVSINDRTMLPIRFIAESFQFTVDWAEETQTITIHNSASPSEGTDPGCTACGRRQNTGRILFRNGQYGGSRKLYRSGSKRQPFRVGAGRAVYERRPKLDQCRQPRCI